jgi:hypothetical protein
MGANYPNTRHRKAADRLTLRFGGAATLVRLTEGGINDWGSPTVTETSYAVRAIVTGQREAFGVTPGLDAGDRHALVNTLATGAVPAIGDRLTLGGETVTLLEVEPVKPDPDQAAIVYRVVGKP